MILSFRHEVDEICTLLGNCTAYSGNSVPILDLCRWVQ